MVFRTYGSRGGRTTRTSKLPITAQQDALSAYMQHAWASFAKDPYGTGPGWAPLGSGEDLGILGNAGSSGVTVVNRNLTDSRCGLFEALYSP